MKELVVFTPLLALINTPAYSVKFINNSDEVITKIFYLEKRHAAHIACTANDSLGFGDIDNLRPFLRGG